MSTKTGNKSILLRVLIVLFCGYMLVSVGTLIAELSSKRETLAQLQDQKEQTELRIEEKENLKNSPLKELIERAAREFGFVYPNEQVFIDVN